MATLGETASVDALLDHAGTGGGYDLPYTRIRELQVVALNERFQQQGKRIRLVKLRAEEAGITEISELADAVPLLLPHTAYKNYPESFLIEERWDRLTKWLGTVSAHPISM